MIHTKLLCENPQCSKLHSPAKSPSDLLLSSCCSALLCTHCFHHPSHRCPNTSTIPLDHFQTSPCSRCKTKLALFTCLNCTNHAFCSDCSKNVHSILKFSFHSIIPMNSVNPKTINQNQKSNPLQELLQQSNLSSTKQQKISPKLEQIEYQNTNQPKDQYFTTFLQLRHKLDHSQFSINLKKSSSKIQELALNDKFAQIERTIDDAFKSLKQKVTEKYQSIKFIFKQQTEISINECLKYSQFLKIAENEVTNMKVLLSKKTNSNDHDPAFQDFIQTKSKLLDKKIKSLNERPNFKDLKLNVSKDLLEQINKISNDIQCLNMTALIKNEAQPKLQKNDECLVNLKERQKKKTMNNLYKPKNNEIQTAKKTLNISVSNHPNQQIGTNLKNKNRKISIELYESHSITELGEIDNKTKNLQRIKSFEFLSFTNSKNSFQSITQLKTQKKPNPKPQNQYTYRKESSNKDFHLNYIRTKIEHPNLNDEGDSENFIKTSSQLVASTSTLPSDIGKTRTKPNLYQVLSPKGNIAAKQKITNSNKTFSATMNSPSNKITVSAFKSPNAKSKIFNDTKQQGLSSPHQFDSKILKKNIAT